MVELILVSVAVIVGAGLVAVACYLLVGLVLAAIAATIRRVRSAVRS
jgi:hypothetical protein